MYRGIDQWAGRQNSGNQWCWTENETRIKRNEDSLRDLLNIKHTNVLIRGVPEGKEREEVAEHICEDIIAKNFPTMGKETDIQVQVA